MAFLGNESLKASWTLPKCTRRSNEAASPSTAAQAIPYGIAIYDKSNKGVSVMTVNQIARNQMSQAMMRVASGQRINSAADDAAGLAIMETMTAQVRGFDQGTRNVRDMQALVNTAEGGLDTIGESLNRIRELTVQAANDTNSPANRRAIQTEVNQLVDHINTTVQNAQFNNINLLDGTASNGLHTAASPDGSGPSVVIRDMRDMAQAITSFNFETSSGSQIAGLLDQIDPIRDSVNMERANLGAMSNRFDHIVEANTTASINLQDARSRIGDADMAREMMRVNQEQALTQVQILMQLNAMEREEDRLPIGATSV